VRAGHWPEHQDQHRQTEGSGQAVLQQLETDIIRGQPLRGDTGTHHDSDEQTSSKELGGCSAQKVWPCEGGVRCFHVGSS